MTKKYVNPMLLVVSISKNDIIATSNESMGFMGDYEGTGSDALAPGRRGVDDWDAGY